MPKTRPTNEIADATQFPNLREGHISNLSIKRTGRLTWRQYHAKIIIGVGSKRMLPRSAVVLHRTGVIAAFFFLLVVTANVSKAAQVRCSEKCVAENCNTIGIKYGKFCGVGWTGCAGEEPCDDLDACCKTHDECVEKHGMIHIKCHEKFKRCIKKVHKSGKEGFSKTCPYNVAVPTMTQGMDMAILFSQLGNQKIQSGNQKIQSGNQKIEL